MLASLIHAADCVHSSPISSFKGSRRYTGDGTEGMVIESRETIAFLINTICVINQPGGYVTVNTEDWVTVRARGKVTGSQKGVVVSNWSKTIYMNVIT